MSSKIRQHLSKRAAFVKAWNDGVPTPQLRRMFPAIAIKRLPNTRRRVHG